ncbi:ribosome hibernation-promoting factor, HPF/YfiA family [Ravibacter arvi]
MQAVRFNADERLLAFIQQKMNKLETFYDNITSGDVFLKLDKSENNKIQKKLVEVKLYVPGGSVFVREAGTTFEEATDLAIDTLKMRVKKFKNKRAEVRNGKPLLVEADTEDQEEI